jgi:hypothetical protein
MAKQRPAWIDKSDVRGTENIGFYDCFEADTAGVVHPRDVIAMLTPHGDALADLVGGAELNDQAVVSLVRAVAEPIALHLAFADLKEKRERRRALRDAVQQMQPAELILYVGLDSETAENALARLNEHVAAGRPDLSARARLVAKLATAFREWAGPDPDLDVAELTVEGEETLDSVRDYRRRLDAFIFLVFDVCKIPDRPSARMLDAEIPAACKQ